MVLAGAGAVNNLSSAASLSSSGSFDAIDFHGDHTAEEQKGVHKHHGGHGHKHKTADDPNDPSSIMNFGGSQGSSPGSLSTNSIA